jgi:heme-degrading monooxygenase HmoA
VSPIGDAVGAPEHRAPSARGRARGHTRCTACDACRVARQIEPEDDARDKESTMPKFVEMDPEVTLSTQMEEMSGPVILINTLTANADEIAPLLRAWTADASWMKRQPGFISAQLHRGIGESCVFLTYAVWESSAHFRRAFTHPEFRSHLGQYPPSTVVSPHLFQKLAIPGICVD